jgi:hypothetical protein
MEAVIAIVRNLLNNPRNALVLGVVLGGIMGFIFAWGLWPVEVVDTTPEVMRADLQEDWLRMAAETYARTNNPDDALRRWNESRGRGWRCLRPTCKPTPAAWTRLSCRTMAG